jgi:hypothetical protein
MTAKRIAALIVRLRPVIGWGSLRSNHHGALVDAKNWAVKRSTASIVVLGRGRLPRRTLYALRLWLYGPSGACVNFDVGVRFIADGPP